MLENNNNESALHVNEGVEQPSSVNQNYLSKFKPKKKKRYSVDELVDGIFKSDITLLGKAITYVESTLIEHQDIAQQVIERCLPKSGNSIRVGITGVPGVGKSTFIEAMGNHVIEAGNKLAVLAIDPSSERSKGSILGDKTRMEKLSSNLHAFIRPSPSAGSLGGVARKTRETIILCEAAGYNVIFIETVGVGQSEIAVHSMTDFFLLLMLSGAGDELQGIKRGIMEMANALVITKADGDNVSKAEQARVEYKNALHLFPLPKSKWEPKALTVSSVNNKGMDELWRLILDYKLHSEQNGFFKENRKKQAKYWVHETILESIKDKFYNHSQVKNRINSIEELVIKNEISPYQAALELMKLYESK